MKKMIMALALIASTVAIASVDVYEFKSTMNVYSLSKQKYVATPFNGTLTVDTETGDVEISATKKDTKETYILDLTDAETASSEFVSTTTTVVIDTVAGTTNETVVATTNVVAGTDSSVFSIISGKKDSVGARYMSAFTDDGLMLQLAGAGTAKTKVTGCGPCGDSTSCIKITTLKGTYIGAYDCGCSNGQHYDYDGSCVLPDEKETTVCPVYGTWSAKLKTVDGAKYK